MDGTYQEQARVFKAVELLKALTTPTAEQDACCCCGK